jgi:hypothetical protein
MNAFNQASRRDDLFLDTPSGVCFWHAKATYSFQFVALMLGLFQGELMMFTVKHYQYDQTFMLVNIRHLNKNMHAAHAHQRNPGTEH